LMANKNPGIRLLGLGLLEILVLILGLGARPASAQAQPGGQWSEPLSLSARTPEYRQKGWFPDMVMDSQGAAHVIWLVSDNTTSNGAQDYDRVFYQAISPEGVPSASPPANIAISDFGFAPRTSIAIDNKRGLLHMVFRSFKGSVYYQYAPLNAASTPAAWSTPRNIDDFSGVSYYSDVAVDKKGVIHAVWTQVKPGADGKYRQVVMYRQSSDLGKTWSFPKTMAEPKNGASRVTLRLDADDGLHLSWDDGYDNLLNQFKYTYGVYTHSTDGGQTWSTPLVVGSESDPVGQTMVTPFGSSGVMLIWRDMEGQKIGYIVSNDRGQTWSAPADIPGFVARRLYGQNQFDRYSLAADATGHVYLAAVGMVDKAVEVETPDDVAVYFIYWDKGIWAQPETVARLKGFPEYVRIGVGADRVHLVWFTRDAYIQSSAQTTWYASRPFNTGFTSEPVGTFVPPPPATPFRADSTPTLVQPTPVPIAPPEDPVQVINQSADWAWWLVALSLVPLIAIGIGFSMLIKWLKRTENRFTLK